MRDPQISPIAGDIVRSTIYKNRRERHVTGRNFDRVTYEAAASGHTKVTGCDIRAWQRWCAHNKVEIVQLGPSPAERAMAAIYHGDVDGDGSLA